MRLVIDRILLLLGNAFAGFQVGGPVFLAAVLFSTPLPVAVGAGLAAGAAWTVYVNRKIDEGVRKKVRPDERAGTANTSE